MATNIWRPGRLLLFGALMLLLSACATASATGSLPGQTWYVDPVRFNRGAHAGLDCGECHTDIAMKDVPERHPSGDNIGKEAVTLFDYRACARCHPQEYAAYRTGVHAEVLDGTRKPKEDMEAPVCGNCHSPHYSQPNLARAELIANQVETCGECHPVQRDTYLANYHGKAAVHLADTRSAGCTDCHGGHQVASLTEEKAALGACQQCHPDASPNLAGVLIHAEESIPAPDARRATESTVLFYAKIFFTLLIVGVLGFFYAHTVAWLVRSAHNRMRGG